jgi:hypothetical protein
MLTTEYNVTVDSMASASLRIQNFPIDQQRATRAGTQSGDVPESDLVSLWFYDDGETSKSFDLGVQDLVPVGPGFSLVGFNISVRDATSSASGQYLMTSQDFTTQTGVMRSVGWHLAEFLSGTTGTRVLLDGTAYPGNEVYALVRPESVVLQAVPTAESGSATNAVWIDDVRFQPNVTEAPSSFAGPWSDDLESGISAAWGNTFIIPTFQLSDAYDHTGDATSSFSLAMPSGGTLPGNLRITELPKEEPLPADLNFWFYDDGQTTAGYLLGANVAEFTAGPGKLRGCFVGIGAIDTPDMLIHDYVLSKDGVTSATGIPRSEGWHSVLLSTTLAGLKVKLDNQDFADNFFPDFTRITQLNLRSVFMDDISTGMVWIDDITYARTGPPSSVDEWSLYY